MGMSAPRQSAEVPHRGRTLPVSRPSSASCVIGGVTMKVHAGLTLQGWQFRSQSVTEIDTAAVALQIVCANVHVSIQRLCVPVSILSSEEAGRL